MISRSRSAWLRRPQGTVAILLVVGSLATAACGDDDGTSVDNASAADLISADTILLVANSAGTVTTNGPQRVMVALLGEGPNDFLGGADSPASFEFATEDGASSTEAPGTWLSTAGVNLGLYVTHVTFPTEGVWKVRVIGTEGPWASFNVGTESPVPETGDPAPQSQTPTAGADLTAVSTDPDPAPDFYQYTVAEAVASGKPSVIVFATPAFCQTAVCGPTIEIAKQVAIEHPEAVFVHVEPYDIAEARTGNLVPVDAMADWNLQTEPWVFVVDDSGMISASFEGVVGAPELSAALSGL